MIKYLARYTTATAVQQLMWQDDDTAVQSSDHMIQVSNQPASLLLSAVRTPSLATSWSCIAARQKCLNASPAGSQTLSLSAWYINDHVVTTNPGSYSFEKTGHALRILWWSGAQVAHSRRFHSCSFCACQIAWAIPATNAHSHLCSCTSCVLVEAVGCSLKPCKLM